jgi:ribosome-associated heat shock protein Hsp15
VRINGQRIDARSRTVRRGDVVTVALDRAVHVIKVLDFSERRGSADEARRLCEVLSPPSQGKDAPACPQAGGRRPTKRERRAIDWLTGANDG